MSTESGRIRSRLCWLAGLMLSVVLLATACSNDEPEALRGAVRTPEPDVSRLSLGDVMSDNKQFALRANENELLLVFFGFASCPDICPTTMAEIRLARQDLGDRQDRVKPAFVTVDPERDTPELLADYVRSFAPDGIALRTEDREHLTNVANTLGASYQIEPGDSGEPVVAHSSYLYAVDDQGKLRVQWSFGTPRADIVHDLDILLDRIDAEDPTA